MRLVHGTIAAGALMLLAASGRPVHAQAPGARTTAQTTYVPAANDSGYSSRLADFVTGKRLYLRSTKTFIGTIIDVAEQHDFPPDRFPRPRMKAVLVVRRDGPHDWLPVEGLNKIYVAR
jgi:hypothetical protein